MPLLPVRALLNSPASFHRSAKRFGSIALGLGRVMLLTALVLLFVSIRGKEGTHALQSCVGDVTCPAGVGLQDPICHLVSPDSCGNCPGVDKRISHDGGTCCYFVTSPIVIDLEGTGFHLTDIPHGVTSPIVLSFHKQYEVSWTAAGSNDAWLVLDRDGDGRIDDFTEMFGNFTPQPDPPPGQMKNGFLALAVFDQPEFGGNNDGWITAEDQIFSKLRVWQDKNHDGISQPDELHTLESVGITGISLHYTLSQRRDRFGNSFRFHSVIRSADGSEVGKSIYDVFLLVGDKN
jgi:hypothetical protein